MQNSIKILEKTKKELLGYLVKAIIVCSAMQKMWKFLSEHDDETSNDFLAGVLFVDKIFKY